MYWRHKKFLFLLVMIGILIAAGCNQPGQDENTPAKDQVKSPEVIKVGLLGQVLNLDPVNIDSYLEMQVARTIYEGLFSFDLISGELTPNLVDNWQLSPDRLTYNFNLKQGVKFHSGRVLTAEDIKFSWERFLRKKQPRDLINTFSKIAGADDYMQGKAADVIGIKVIDDYSLQVVLEEPNDLFLLYLTHPAASVLDRQVIQLVGDRYGTSGTYQTPAPVLVGTGPFSFVEWIGNRQLTLQKFEQYHGQKSAASRLEFHFYSDQETVFTDYRAEYLDLVLSSVLPDPVAKIANDQISYRPGNRIIYLGFNVTEKPYDLVELRLAIQYALNREELAGTAAGTAAVQGLFPRRLVQERSPLMPYQYNEQAVQRLLAGENIFQVKEKPLTLSYLDRDPLGEIAEKVKAQVEAFGFQIDLRPLTKDEFSWASTAGELGFYLSDWQFKIPTAENFLAANLRSQGRNNFSGFADANFDELLQFIQNGAEKDNERLESFLQVERMVMTQVPIISLLETSGYLIQRPNLHGVDEMPLGLISWKKLWCEN